MTQNEKDRLQYMIDVMQAYKDGKEIECKNVKCTTWVTCYNLPIWDWRFYDYRVKPEPPKPKYRPFEGAAEIMEAIKEHGSYIVSGLISNYIQLIVEFNDIYVWCGVSRNGEIISFYFENNYTFADGTPFGKLIEE